MAIINKTQFEEDTKVENETNVKKETKLCKHCKTEIPKDAKICSNCRKKQGGIGKWIVIAIVVIVILAALTGGGDSDSQTASDSSPKKTGQVENTNTASGTKQEENTTPAAETEAQEEVSNVFVVGDVVETSDLKITYIGASEWTSDNQFITPADGNVFYRMEFEFENIGDSDQTISSMLNWSCYADGYAADQSWCGDDQIDATIAPGKKAKGAVYFEVPADAQEIELNYETNFWTEDKVIFVVK